MEHLSLLICDLDGTLLGDDEALRRFADWRESMRARFRLAYSSGRFIQSVMRSIETTDLPAPDAIIGGVGTEVFIASSAQQLASWPPAPEKWNPGVIRDIVAAHPELILQPEEFLSRNKLSCYGYDLEQPFLDRLANELRQAGQTANLVYSSNRDLDIVPVGVDKGSAAAFLAGFWGIPAKRVYVAGDSGNDASMFRAGFQGIVVGNALPELKAIESPRIYRARAEFADGVLEGLEYWLNGHSKSARLSAVR